MPREHKRRGRRGISDKKRTRDESEGGHDQVKRRRTLEASEHEDQEFIPLEENEHYQDQDFAEDEDLLPSGNEKRFYGLLDEQEQEYFKRADDILEVNQFSHAEERTLFVANVHKEASGKELKLACSQSSSKLLERIILLSSPDQLKGLFQQFGGEFLQLMSHRFASHCCETLFIQSAPIVSEELASESRNYQGSKPNNEEQSSMEHHFINVTNELYSNVGYMTTNKHASHALRVLLATLAGHSPNSAPLRSLLAGKHKKHVDVPAPAKSAPIEAGERRVPQAFIDALHLLIEQSVASLDTSHLRVLATHMSGNPTLQLLLQLELTLFGKHPTHEPHSILDKLLPGETIGEDHGNSSFVNGMLFDPIGSHLLETIVKYSPGKVFKGVYRESIKPRLKELSRNLVASYVVCAALERIGAQDLEEAMTVILAEVSTLAERGRTSIFKTLAERCYHREIDSTPLANALKTAYSTDDSFGFSLQELLQLPADIADGSNFALSNPDPSRQTTPAQNAASLLAQSLLQIPGPLSALVVNSLINIEPPIVKHIALISPLSPILQTALTAETTTIIFRRKLITHLYGSIASLSTSPSGSHVVDAIEVGTRKDLAFVRERVAEELAESASILRGNPFGRKVWKNWDMNLYQRDRAQWVRNTRMKVGNNGFQSLPGLLGETDTAAKERGEGALGRVHAAVSEAFAESKEAAQEAMHEKLCEPVRETSKTALDRARERYAQKHAK